MPSKLLTLSVAVAAATLLPATANAYEILGKKLEIYGKAHVSADFVDNDTDSELAIASNSSRLGFKGTTPINDDLNALYQIESKIVFDEGGSNFAGRNTFVGVGGGFGKVLVGNNDTPHKNVRGDFDIFGDTVGDARNIMDQGNNRAKNSIMYATPSLNGLKAAAMYSTSYEDTQTDEGIEDNDFKLYSLGLGYEVGGLLLSAGYESATTGEEFAELDTSAMRVAAIYDFGGFSIGGIYDNFEIEDEFGDDVDRDAWGVNAAMKFGASNKLKVQYVIADDWSDIDDSGASQLTVGIDHKMADQFTVYGAYNLIDNDDNASYRLKGGHDTDVYEVASAGDEISVFSLGMIYSF
ncbi:porin [Pseudomonas saliphila]|uniref:porin n=1 Tax=Pseudomonas saliphila TaxID=2586906 RepID=UPI0015B4F3B0|nr:porin [Pseudomonas saliphila]